MSSVFTGNNFGVIEPTATSQMEDDTTSEKSAVSTSAVNIEVGSNQGDQGDSESQGRNGSVSSASHNPSFNQASSNNVSSRGSTKDTQNDDSHSDFDSSVGGGRRDGYGLYVPPDAPRYPGDDGRA